MPLFRRARKPQPANQPTVIGRWNAARLSGTARRATLVTLAGSNLHVIDDEQPLSPRIAGQPSGLMIGLDRIGGIEVNGTIVVVSVVDFFHRVNKTSLQFARAAESDHFTRVLLQHYTNATGQQFPSAWLRAPRRRSDGS